MSYFLVAGGTEGKFDLNVKIQKSDLAQQDFKLTVSDVGGSKFLSLDTFDVK